MTRSPHSDISRIRWATYVAAGFVALFTGLFAFVLPLTAGRMHQPSAALLERLAFWRMLHDLRSPSLDDPVSAAALVLTTAAAGLGGCLLGVLAGWLGPDARARRLVLGVSAA
ncbi:MAG TPA: hypothetical protein VKU85_17060, partial [bacterium]|nr:hypothetical protein [bacterium]